MNKTFTAAVAVAAIAGLVSAEIATAPAGYVESADTTGVQYVCNPFNSFTGNTPTLGDLDGSNLNHGTDKIIIIGANGKKLFTARYLTDGTGMANWAGAGWYEDTGDGYGGCSNTFPLVRGTAVQFTGGSGNKLVMAGTLSDDDGTPPLQSGYNFVGNVSAVATNLNAVTLGGNYKYANDYLVLDGKKYVYLPEKKGSYEAGWYFRDYLLLGKTDNVTAGLVAPALAPGKGFYVYTKNSGATIRIHAK